MTNAADDFDALFDEVSAQSAAAAKPAPTAAPAPAVIADDDSDALFDSVSASGRRGPLPRLRITDCP